MIPHFLVESDSYKLFGRCRSKMAAKPSEAECEQLSKALLWHILMYMPNGSTI